MTAGLTPAFAQPQSDEAPIGATAESVAMPVWSRANADSLLRAIEASADEGLDPRDYRFAALKSALATGRIPSDLATTAALRLARDYQGGHVGSANRVGWHLDATVDDDALLRLIAEALARNRLEDMLQGLLPQHDGYKALRLALTRTAASDRQRIDRLRVNLERWRWMPRDLGERYVLVNVPAYKVRLVDQGAVISEHEVIVGKLGSPTPAFAATITAITFNPSWYVPPSLKAQKLRMMRRSPAQARRLGYSLIRGGNGVGIHQRPGPANALGQMKLVMPNAWDIYLHDTPNKSLFAGASRLLSAGCVRVQRPIDLAQALLDGGEWDRARIDGVLTGRRTTTANLPRDLPVYVTYLTAEADAAGAVTLLPDPYARDARIARALDSAPLTASAAK